MNNELTQEQVDFYQENGYIVIENFLTPEELETWRQRMLTARWRGVETASWLIGSDLDDESEEGKYRRRRFVQRINLVEGSRRYARVDAGPAPGQNGERVGGSRWHARLARSSIDQAALGQPDRLAPG